MRPPKQISISIACSFFVFFFFFCKLFCVASIRDATNKIRLHARWHVSLLVFVSTNKQQFCDCKYKPQNGKISTIRWLIHSNNLKKNRFRIKNTIIETQIRGRRAIYKYLSFCFFLTFIFFYISQTSAVSIFSHHNFWHSVNHTDTCTDLQIRQSFRFFTSPLAKMQQ